MHLKNKNTAIAAKAKLLWQVNGKEHVNMYNTTRRSPDI